jgi:preprotein translocase subunit SecF
MHIIKNRKIFYTISGVLVGVSIVSLLLWGLNLGIDFTGGSLLEVSYAANARPVQTVVQSEVSALNLGDASVSASASNGYIIRTKSLTDVQRGELTTVLQNGQGSGFQVVHFDNVGPILGQELQGKAITSIIVVIIAIVLFITFAFRKVSEPVSSWKYGLVAIVALLHDVIVPLGFFSILGHFAGTEIDTLFITALLVILGFSVHDTIVVFDRVRENLKHSGESRSKNRKSFEEIVGDSVSQTFTRSINTSLTVLLSLVVLYFVGAVATQDFALAMFVGILSGTYSSIFLGSPLLVTLETWQRERAQRAGK